SRVRKDRLTPTDQAQLIREMAVLLRLYPHFDAVSREMVKDIPDTDLHRHALGFSGPLFVALDGKIPISNVWSSLSTLALINDFERALRGHSTSERWAELLNPELASSVARDLISSRKKLNKMTVYTALVFDELLQ